MSLHLNDKLLIKCCTRSNWQTTIQDAQSKADGLNDEKTVLMTYAKDLEARWKQARCRHACIMT